MSRRPLLSPNGFSLIDCLLAVGILSSGVLALCALFALGTEQLTLARDRTVATMLARARLESLVADVDAGLGAAAGDEQLDASGRQVERGGYYRCVWSVASVPGSTSLLRLSVSVQPSATLRTRRHPVRLVTLHGGSQP